jgi:hypothetical protein
MTEPINGLLAVVAAAGEGGEEEEGEREVEGGGSSGGGGIEALGETEKTKYSDKDNRENTDGRGAT